MLEQSHKPAPKILVSGDGRCNFINMHATPANYISSNLAFVHYAMGKFSLKHFIALIKAAEEEGLNLRRQGQRAKDMVVWIETNQFSKDPSMKTPEISPSRWPPITHGHCLIRFAGLSRICITWIPL